MRRALLSFAALSCVTIGAWACSSKFTTAANDGGVDAVRPGEPEGGAGLDSGTSGEDTSDATIRDAAGDDDGSSDAAAYADAGKDSGLDGGIAPVDCATIDAALCADFSTAPVTYRWSTANPLLANGATFGFDTTTYISPSESLLATAGLGDAGRTSGGASEAYLQEIFPAGVPHLRLALDLRPSTAIVSPSTFVVVALGKSPTLETFSFQFVANIWQVSETTPASQDGGGQSYAHQLLFGPSLGTWSRLTFDLDNVGRTLQVQVDGTVVIDDPYHFASSTDRLTISVGLQVANSAVPTTTANIDDVVMQIITP